MAEVKYPDVEVQLSGSDGNAFAVIAKVSRAMREGGCTSEEVDEFRKEAMSDDYDHLLQTAMRFVEVS